MTSPTAPIPGATVTLPRAAVLGGGAAALVAVGALAGALMMKPASAPEPAGPSAAQAAVSPQSLAAMPPSTATAATTAPPRSDKPAPVQSSAHRVGDTTTNPTTPPAARPGGTPRSTATPLNTQAAMGPVACAQCGVVESVAAVVQKGEGSGVGAVAGGVLGGVLGHQIGGGNGRKAMTVIGAVGGGLAGHEIEKRQRSTTSYRVKVRMDDGSMRTVNRSDPIASGTRVTVDGNALHVRRDSAADAPRTMQTGGQQS